MFTRKYKSEQLNPLKKPYNPTHPLILYHRLPACLSKNSDSDKRDNIKEVTQTVE